MIIRKSEKLISFFLDVVRMGQLLNSALLLEKKERDAP